MRSFLVSSAVVSLAAFSALAGCNNQNDSRPYIDVTLKLRCPPPMTTGCAVGCTQGVDRRISGYENDPGVSISCSVTENAADRFVSFTVRNGTGQSLQFRNVQVPRATTFAIAGEVILIDGEGNGNEFRGAAGSAAPSTAQPCQISAMEFSTDPDTGDSRMRGQVLCDAMRAPADSTLCRGLAAAGATSAVPAQFDIYACRGLNP